LSLRQLLAVAALVVVGVLAWDLLRPQAAPEPEAPALAARPSAAPAAKPPPAPLGPAQLPAAPNFLRPPPGAIVTASPLARDFGNALAWKPIYERLRNTTEGETPEGKYFLYRILRACATVADRKGGPQTRTQNAALLEERRQQIAASYKEGDPRLEQRMEAFDKATADQCAGLSGVTVTETELGQLLKGALDGGDPKARAWQIEQDMWQERRASNAPGRAGATLGESQIVALREAFSSRDPEAIVIAGRVLANSFRDLTVRAGPDQDPVENRMFMNAALLLACEYGYACGENNARVLDACAFQGHCGVASLPDYLFYYGASPYDAQLLDRYRGLLRQAAETGDWSAITIERGNRSPNSVPYGGMAGHPR
jgi:hypothetical protein